MIRPKKNTARIFQVGFLAFAFPALLLSAETYDRVIVLGFDGADYRLVRQYLEEGSLPNLDRLSRQGAFSSLQTTNPPQTPVSWSTFATGLNPGKTEIFDFLKRQKGSYFPTFAMNEERRTDFLFGARNPLVFGSILAVITLLLCVGVCLGTGYRRLGIFLASPGLALGAGLAGWFFTAAFLPTMRPDAVNNRQGESLWKITSRQGIPTQVIRVPVTFPAESGPDLTLLSGLGVPDIRGRVGTPSYYTSSPDMDPGDNEFSLEIIRLAARTGTLRSRIIGPSNKPFFEYRVQMAGEGIKDAAERRSARMKARSELEKRGVPERLEIPVEFTVHPETESCRIRVGTQIQDLRPGEWSDWLVFDFPVNWLVDRLAPLRGIGRFRLMSLEPDLKIYLSPINFHPNTQPIPFSSPGGFAQELVDRFGLFKTIGWAIDTWTPTQRLAGDEFLLEDLYFTVDQYESMLEGLLEDHQRGLFIQVFMFTDRIAHLFWRFLDPKHPLYDPERAARYAPEVRKAYQRMDSIVGRVMERMGDRTLLIVCSDHGFSSFRRSVNYNTWLVRNGFMTLKSRGGEVKTLEDLFDRGEFFQNVDWSRTKAYAIGLGNLYINLAGREPAGVVLPGESYEEVREAIVRGLEGLVDGETGERPVSKVFRREEMYTGFDPTVVGDLRVGNAEGYRVSWQTALGGVPAKIFTPNLKPWSGDHCSLDPAEVPGILLSSVPLRATQPGMADLFPSVLQALGLEIPEGIDGKSVY